MLPFGHGEGELVLRHRVGRPRQGSREPRRLPPSRPHRLCLGRAPELLERHGLYDANLLGNGDTDIAHAMFGSTNYWGHRSSGRARGPSPPVGRPVRRRCRGKRRHVDGVVSHLWHGSPSTGSTTSHSTFSGTSTLTATSQSTPRPGSSHGATRPPSSAPGRSTTSEPARKTASEAPAGPELCFTMSVVDEVDLVARPSGAHPRRLPRRTMFSCRTARKPMRGVGHAHATSTRRTEGASTRLESGGRVVQAHLEAFLETGARWWFKVDPDTVVRRASGRCRADMLLRDDPGRQPGPVAAGRLHRRHARRGAAARHERDPALAGAARPGSKLGARESVLPRSSRSRACQLRLRPCLGMPTSRDPARRSRRDPFRVEAAARRRRPLRGHTPSQDARRDGRA